MGGNDKINATILVHAKKISTTGPQGTCILILPRQTIKNVLTNHAFTTPSSQQKDPSFTPYPSLSKFFFTL